MQSMARPISGIGGKSKKAVGGDHVGQAAAIGSPKRDLPVRRVTGKAASLQPASGCVRN